MQTHKPQERTAKPIEVVIFLSLILLLIYGIYSPTPERVCRREYVIERRLGLDVHTGTTDIEEARKLAPNHMIYLEENCR